MKILIDSSIVIKWFNPFDEEESSKFAIKIRDLYELDQCELYAPSLLDYEINNIVSIGIRRKKISKQSGFDILSNFMNYYITKYDLKEEALRILEISQTYNLSSYDASYVALAEELGYNFFTADKKLYNKLKSEYANVKYITQFKAH